MITEDDIIDKLTISVTQNVAGMIQGALADIVEQEISKALARALFEGKYHRGVNTEVLAGIENVVEEISSFKKNLSKSSSGSNETAGLLDCSTSALDDIISSTERATLNILDHIDQVQPLLQSAKECASSGNNGPDQVERLESIESIMNNILTELSFQDLTGQKIRLVIKSLKRVEELVGEVYLMAQALHKTKEKSPDKDIEELKEEAKLVVTDLRQRSDTIDQQEVDALFKELGL